MFCKSSVQLLSSLPFFALIILFTVSCHEDKDTEPPEEYFESVKIGKDTWMVKNLDVVTYRNGDPITHMDQVKGWLTATSGAWCVYNNDTSHLENLGRMYNWHAVNDSRNIAPEGWHVATYSEWQALINTLGGVDSAGAKLKEVGFTYWAPPNAWWLNSPSSPGYAYSMQLSTITEKAYTSENLKNFGAYVRCVKD